MTDVLTEKECELVEFNSESNHVHMLVRYPPKQAISNIAHGCKGRSSPIRRPEYPELARALLSGQETVVPIAASA